MKISGKAIYLFFLLILINKIESVCSISQESTKVKFLEVGVLLSFH